MSSTPDFTVGQLVVDKDNNRGVVRWIGTIKEKEYVGESTPGPHAGRAAARPRVGRARSALCGSAAPL